MNQPERLPPRPRRPRSRPRRQADRPRPRRRRRRRIVPRIQAVRDAGVRQRPAQAGDLRHQPGLRPARREGRGGRLRARLRRVGGRDRARRRRRARRQGRPFRQLCRGPGPHQPQALQRRQPARRARLRRQGEAAGNDRRLCPRQGRARAAGHRQPRRVLAGGRDRAAGRPDLPRHPPAGAGQRVGGGGVRRPAGIRLLRLRRPRRLSALHRRPTPGSTRSTRRCARRCSISNRFRRRPARWTWCSAPAGPASCCTRRSATASKATSTARRPRPSPA